MNYLLRLTEEEHKRLKKLAAEKGVSMKELILKQMSEAKKLIREWLKK